jgi:hypothetical protein
MREGLLTVDRAINTGYYVGAEDTFGFGLELMNEVTEARDAVLTIEWGYLPSRPQDFRPVTIVWLDVHGGNGCVKNGSDLLSPDGTATFSSEMPNPWTMTSSGRVVVAAGHLHDSGVDMQTMKNGEVVCDSVAGYGESAGFVDAKMVHISSMSKCDTLTVREGDKWSVKANYNFENHSPMMEGLTPAPVMGIAMLYIAP